MQSSAPGFMTIEGREQYIGNSRCSLEKLSMWIITFSLALFYNYEKALYIFFLCSKQPKALRRASHMTEYKFSSHKIIWQNMKQNHHPGNWDRTSLWENLTCTAF